MKDYVCFKIVKMYEEGFILNKFKFREYLNELSEGKQKPSKKKMALRNDEEVISDREEEFEQSEIEENMHSNPNDTK